jgi:hypothetical protein
MIDKTHRIPQHAYAIDARKKWTIIREKAMILHKKGLSDGRKQDGAN